MENETASAPESAGAELPATDTPPPFIPAKIKVVVVQQAVTEDKKKYLKNQVLEVTPERLIALGDFVRPWIDPKIAKVEKAKAGATAQTETATE